VVLFLIPLIRSGGKNREKAHPNTPCPPEGGTLAEIAAFVWKIFNAEMLNMGNCCA
jgi:hypothetical protein